MTSKPLRILHLNASSSGGAFVAAQRLNDALNGLDGVSSEHWVLMVVKVIFTCGPILGLRKNGPLDCMPWRS